MKTRLMKGKINYQINPFIHLSIYNVPKENNYKTNYT